MKYKTKIKCIFSIIWSEIIFMIENMRYGKWVHFPVSPCHSLRVGACVLLHSSNASADTIKWRLCWKSDSYRMYLRDTAAIAKTHNLCVAYTDPDAANLSTGVHGSDLHLDLERGFSSFSSAPSSGPAKAVLWTPTLESPRILYERKVITFCIFVNLDYNFISHYFI